ncbi:hypothetical protein EC991_002916 [Linnemannia zychae]|nr:hypothetical protein EC991_002916 [Linnemannia zychae]
MDGSTRLHREGQLPSRPTRHSSSSRYTSTSSFGSATTRFTNHSLTFLNGLKERLPEHVQPYFWLGLWFGSAVTIIGLVWIFHSRIFSALQALADFIKGLGPLGPLVIMFCLFATSFPPMIGYSSIVTMSGYVYGFVYGFLYAFMGAMAGAIVCFYFCRRWFKAQVRKLMAKNKSLKGVVRTVEKRGFRLLVLIRLAPYPYNVMNAILSATHIPLSTFTAATAMSLIKLTLHVYIGSTLSTLTGGDGDDKDPNKDANNGKRVKVFLMVTGVILGVGVGAYVWAIAKREIAITEAARMERRRRRRGSRRHGRSAATFTGDGSGTGGIELNDQQGYIPDVDLTSRDSVDMFRSEATTGRGEGGQDLSDINYFVGGAGEDRYQDYEDDGDHEGNSLFGTAGRPQQQQGRGGDWRNVGAAGGAGADADSSTDSDESDYFDDSDDDDEYEDGVDGERGDLERGFGLSLALEGDRDRAGGFGSHDFGDDGNEALDFSAHHTGLSDSPWGDDDGEEGLSSAGAGGNDLLGGEDMGQASSGRGGATTGVGELNVDDDGWR